MPRTLTVAAAQMEVAPAPTAERLVRAEQLVADAASQGAQLVVLPEVFNTGYVYDESNYERAEPLDGMTAQWMRAAAARHNVHLAGSLMLHEGGEIYNSLLLWAPDGRLWRYDKTYTWGWERAYFRPGRTGPVVAETALGKIGLLICWDSAHRELWASYAGKIDLMLISSCPPNASDPVYHLPGGVQLTLDQMGPLVSSVKGTAQNLFGPMLDEQAAWLGVPMVNTVGCGKWRSPLPRGFLTMLSIVPSAPWLARYLLRANQMEIACAMVPECKIVGADGMPLARVAPNVEGVAVAEVALSEVAPQPKGAQPPTRLPPMSYYLSDEILRRLTAPLYRRAMRKQAASAPAETAAELSV